MWTQFKSFATSLARSVALIGLAAILGSISHAATITGTVKGVDGAPFQGAFVEAQNTKTRMTFIALSDGQGHYRVENVLPGEYRIQIRAVGFQADARTGVDLTADQNASIDLALKPGTVHWNDLNTDQYQQLWPAGRGKDLLIAKCNICHSFQTRMASVQRDRDGWRDRVQYMRTAMYERFGENGVTDQDADDIAGYLASLFGPDSVLPKSPAEMPAYKSTVRTYTSDAMNIHYVEYDMPGPSRMPFSAAPAKDGSIWIPNFGVANKITRLDPNTGAMEDFPVPNTDTAAVHSAWPGADGKVWIAEQGTNKLGEWDPATRQVVQYQDIRRPPNERVESGGSKHTTRVDPGGFVWSTGTPLTRFDPETKKFTEFYDEVRNSYGIEPDKNGDFWITEPTTGLLDKVEWKTLKITKFKLPTKDFNRRVEIGSKGIVWVGQYYTGKITRFDPETQKFTEFDLPGGAQSFPYGMGLDSNDNIWYASFYLDELGCFDQKTGKFTTYPFPHSENTVREIIRDPQGRMWYGSPSNNKVGYFYLTGKNGTMVSMK